MKTLLIAIGNTLRRDDGVAHRALDLLGKLSPDITPRKTHQLTPELADDMAPFDRVVFVDAVEGTRRGEPSLQLVLEEEPDALSSPLTHSTTPAAVLALSRRLYGFDGVAWLIAIPTFDLGIGEGLSTEGEAEATLAAGRLREFLELPVKEKQ